METVEKINQVALFGEKVEEEEQWRMGTFLETNDETQGWECFPQMPSSCLPRSNPT